MTALDVAAALDDIGTLLALTGENDFRTRAYHNAARTIRQLDTDLEELVESEKLQEVRGIGETLRQKIETLVRTGKLPFLEELQAKVPVGLVEMLRVPGLGAKKVKALNDSLGVDSLATLKEACEKGEVAKLKGFGARTEEKILEGLRFLETVGSRVTLGLAYPLGVALLEQVRQFDGVIKAELCGSLRRKRDTAKDIDLVVATETPESVMEAFINLPQVMQVVAHGSTKSSVIASLSHMGEKVVMNADLRAVTAEQFPVTVLHFTGSKDHNVRLRQRAIERDMTLNEYALTGKDGPLPVQEEADLYRALDLPWIPPELREDTGEIEAAEKGELPKLIEASQIRGVFHNHTTASDGKASLEEMATACKKLGYEYFGVGDHSQSLTVANGLSVDRVRKQWQEIDELNAKLKGIRILKGIECDILKDGSLDYKDEVLAGFDYVVASVHTYFDLSEAEQTDRVCKALSHPAVTMLGHPTGRLLLRRDAYKLNMEKVLAAAKKYDKMVEINAQPDRLDLEWDRVKRAKQLGVLLVINPDAHSPGELGLVPFGVDVARRGWLTADNVFNTRPLKEVVAELERRKQAWQ